MMMVVALSDSVHADSPKKHRGPCEIDYPSDATVEWDCRVIPPGGSLEAIFGEYWVDVARFNRIDRRHALPKNLVRITLGGERLHIRDARNERCLSIHGSPLNHARG